MYFRRIVIVLMMVSVPALAALLEPIPGSGEVDGAASAVSVGAIVELASVLLVDNAIAAVRGKSGRVGREGT
ncbi:hypothetical protein QO002_005161 [Pararhizobium capsulatum DSM 1112]|uniref:Uncharacterized protein n=1 Tax=Pararhizobium capsulatum DSM 1112 TaxID=1121113 RepID=A0ABU0BZU1_9HYPH|nr:hypothetical protein [Pararhizobium capsulatum]MDQ0322955.1 hypothetical protein [Pararhizobium capsulatum DSM 1112]